MKRILTFLGSRSAVLAVALMLAFSPVAHAFTLTVSDGTTTKVIADGSGSDLSSDVGAISYIGSVGVFNLNFTTGLSKPNPINTPSVAYMDLLSLNANSTGRGTLTITLTDGGFTIPLVNTSPNTIATMAIGGTTSGSLTYDAFFGGNKIGTLAFNGANLPGGAFSGAATSYYTSIGDFALTEIVTIIHDKPSATSFDGDITVTPVPEPSTLLLLGGGLLGLAVYGRKRMKK